MGLAPDLPCSALSRSACSFWALRPRPPILTPPGFRDEIAHRKILSRSGWSGGGREVVAHGRVPESLFGFGPQVQGRGSVRRSVRSFWRWLDAAMACASLFPDARCGGQQMAITFDDLPASGERPAAISRLQVAQSILNTLRQQAMPPVYGFVNGVRTEEDPGTLAVLKAWREAGEPLGSHTWSHPDLETITPAAFETEIEENEPLLKTFMAGEDWRWLRYPYLHEGETTEKHRAVRSWLQAHHYRVAEVTMDFEDYCGTSRMRGARRRETR